MAAEYIYNFMEYIKLYIYVYIQLIHISSKNIVSHSLRFINILASNINASFCVWEDTFNKNSHTLNRNTSTNMCLQCQQTDSNGGNKLPSREKTAVYFQGCKRLLTELSLKYFKLPIERT